MTKLSIEHALQVAQKIDAGVRDYVSGDARFAPLWQYHFLLEAFHNMLEHADSEHADFHRLNFHNVCAIMAPDFAGILDIIELP